MLWTCNGMMIISIKGEPAIFKVGPQGGGELQLVHGRGGLGRRLLRGQSACPRSACPCPALEAFWLTEVPSCWSSWWSCPSFGCSTQTSSWTITGATSVNQNASRAGHGHAEHGHAFTPHNSRRPRPLRPWTSWSSPPPPWCPTLKVAGSPLILTWSWWFLYF